MERMNFKSGSKLDSKVQNWAPNTIQEFFFDKSKRKI